MELLRCCKWCRSSNGYDERLNVTGGAPPLFLPQYPSLDAGTAPVAIGEPSRSSNEQNREWIITVKEKINGGTNQAQRSSTRRPSIFRVPKHVRHDSGDGSAEKAYGPMTVPIGPYHHIVNPPPQDSHYLAIQNYKWQALQAIFSRHSDKAHASTLQDACLQWLLNPDVQNTVKGYYSEEINLKADELAQILLLDASFIIHLLLLQQEKNKKAAASTRNEMTTKQNEMTAVTRNANDHAESIQGPLVEGTWTWNLIVYDLLKLENQIPFFVIHTLYYKLKLESDTDELLDLVLDLFSHIRPKRAAEFKIHDHKKPNLYHLLNMFHSSLVYEMKNQPRGNRGRAPERIPSATELKRALIGIKKKKAMEASNFLDITYKNGTIKIPKLQVYDYTDSLFRNLIAYEQCFPGIRPQDAYITLYAVLMDCIIDTPQDARSLVRKGILVSRLSSNEAISELFNKLCRDIHYNIQGSYLEDLFVNLNEDYESRLRQCFASLVMNVFPNRWAVCSVVAGFLLLFLTVLRVGYSLREFYHPHK